MSNYYGSVKHGDEISPAWMQDVEDKTGSGTAALPADYVIWKSGTTYYARDGRTGERTSSSVWATLLNDKILDLYDDGSGTGGNILNLGGVYSQTKTVNMRPGVYVDGVGRGAGLGHATEIDAASDIVMFKFDYPDTTILHYGGLRNLRIDGNALVTTKALVDVNPTLAMNIADIEINHCTIFDGYYGVRINNSTAAHSLWNIDVKWCYIEECLANAILLDSSTNQKISQCKFIGNHFYNNCQSAGNGALEIDGHETRGGVIDDNTFEVENLAALYFNDEAWGWSIGNNVIVDASQNTDNTYSAIRVLGACMDLGFSNNRCLIKDGTKKQKYGYEADNDCDWLVTMGNTFQGKTAGASFGTGANNVGGSGTYNAVRQIT